MPYFLSLMALFSLIQLVQHALAQSVFYGFVGNWNWSGALLVIAIPFLILTISDVAKRFNWNCIVKLFIQAAIAAGGLAGLYQSSSKGVGAALIIAIGLCGSLRYPNIIKRCGLWLALAALVAATIFLYSGGIAMLSDFMLHDVRVALWTGTLNLIQEHVFSGVSQPLFESAYAPYRPVEYYLNMFATDRTPHPHNHLLLFLAANGIFSFIAWLGLLALPLWRAAARFRVSDLRTKLYFFAAIFLLLHGLVDMTLEVWPLNIIFLVLLGILWSKRWDASSTSPDTLPSFWLTRITALAVLLFFTATLAVQLYRETVSSYYFREANIARDQKQAKLAIAHFDKSISFMPMPENIYQAALVAFYDLKNPALCQQYLDQMARLTGFINYVNNNGLKAKALYLQGKRTEALEYFRREAQNFPLSSVNWFFYHHALKEAGLDAEANAAYDKLAQTLAVKGLRFEHIPLLIKNPRLDIHFREVPGRI